MQKQKPDLVIFSSRQLIPVADALRENLKYDFEVTPWKEGFFRDYEVPLNSFLKRIICYDGAVLVLGADDLRKGEDEEHLHVPRDNVIFELGVCMARFGTRKTFIVCPEHPQVTLPSYFKGKAQLAYEDRDDENLIAATGSACRAIKQAFEELDEFAYHSDLPSVGLSFGYFFNFVNPTYARFKGGAPLTFPEDLEKAFGATWNDDEGFTLTIVMPEVFMNRDQVNDAFKNRDLVKFEIHLNDGRDISVYALSRKTKEGALHIFDIPTTLLTCENVITRIDSFWGGGDKKYRQSLARREIRSFRRSINEQISKRLNAEIVKTIEFKELDQFIKDLA